MLKGAFSPEQGLDIQNYRDSAPIGRGQLRLLMLGRSRQGYAPFRSSPGLEQAIPPLHDPNDELLETCKLLLAVNATPERRRKVVLLLSRLRAQEGPA